MKRFIESWKNSIKYTEFKNKEIEIRANLTEFKFSEMDNRKSKDFEKMLEFLILEYSKVTEELIDGRLQTLGTKSEIISEHNKNLAVWYEYLYYFILQENYEVAHQIKVVIALEKKEFFSLMENFRGDLFSDKDFLYKIANNYEFHLNELNKKL